MDPAQTGPVGSFVRAGDAVLSLDSVTDRPALPMPARSSGARVRPVTDRPHTRPAAPAVPLFPARDATITYRSSQDPGTDLRARYDTAGWRVRVDYPGHSWGGVLITDAFARAITRASPSTAEYSVAYLADGPLSERLGRLSRGDRPVLTAQGEDTVAGLRCTVYRIRSEIRDEPEATACVTTDGLQLRRSDATGSTEVVSVRYGEADPDDFQVSSRFKEVAPPR
ncbi:hypothetical protein VQH23_06450 [Pararoseomonas sp. SCSIO 73927]|uniref:hypothetical protein n=1 Tax=Pararoseomonas sp. SCSIO 73927 TaxID=3114537 RepID=UPI0030CBE183